MVAVPATEGGVGEGEVDGLLAIVEMVVLATPTTASLSLALGAKMME